MTATARNRWAPATVFLALWLLLGIAVSGTYGFFALTDETDRRLHLTVAALGMCPIAAVWLEWRRKALSWACLTLCGALVSIYGLVLILSVGEEFGVGFFRLSLGLLVFGAASIAVQILDWTLYR